MNNGLKSGLVLLILGIICGTLLAVVNSFTAPIIDEIEQAAQFDALKQFYFDVNDPDYETNSLTDLFKLEKIDIQDGNVESLFTLKNKTDNTLEAIGYLVSGKGYSDAPIKMLIVIEKDFTVKGYTVVSHAETSGFGADIVDNDFGVTVISDLSGFDSVAGVTKTSNGILECFTIVSQRVAGDFGGDLND